jgi:anti-sigma regulatory factor (Ser/Thr protein kinase)
VAIFDTQLFRVRTNCCESAEAGSRFAARFGMQLAKTLVDELVYNESHNEVAMVKFLD